MIRLAVIALAAALLLPVGAAAELPRAPEAVLAAASDWFVGHWIFEEEFNESGFGPGRAEASLDVRADSTLVMEGSFTPRNAAAPDPEFGFRMTATWWMEDASTLGLRVRLEDVMVSEGGAAPRPGDLVTEVMNLQIRPDGSLYDVDDGITWRR